MQPPNKKALWLSLFYATIPCGFAVGCVVVVVVVVVVVLLVVVVLVVVVLVVLVLLMLLPQVRLRWRIRGLRRRQRTAQVRSSHAHTRIPPAVCPVLLPLPACARACCVPTPARL